LQCFPRLPHRPRAGWISIKAGYSVLTRVTGEASGWTKTIPTGAQSVSVPHTWNIGEFHDYVGLAWYFRHFEMPPVASGTHVELHFGATFYQDAGLAERRRGGCA